MSHGGVSPLSGLPLRKDSWEGRTSIVIRCGQSLSPGWEITRQGRTLRLGPASALVAHVPTQSLAHSRCSKQICRLIESGRTRTPRHALIKT